MWLQVSGQHIHFDCSVHLQLPLEEIGDGWGVIFEFVHYKLKVGTWH
eukprot:SAG31_NODE_11911_length_987_cov_0.825450_4_plen_46_part_01